MLIEPSSPCNFKIPMLSSAFIPSVLAALFLLATQLLACEVPSMPIRPLHLQPVAVVQHTCM